MRHLQEAAQCFKMVVDTEGADLHYLLTGLGRLAAGFKRYRVPLVVASVTTLLTVARDLQSHKPLLSNLGENPQA